VGELQKMKLEVLDQ